MKALSKPCRRSISSTLYSQNKRPGFDRWRTYFPVLVISLRMLRRLVPLCPWKSFWQTGGVRRIHLWGCATLAQRQMRDFIRYLNALAETVEIETYQFKPFAMLFHPLKKSCSWMQMHFPYTSQRIFSRKSHSCHQFSALARLLGLNRFGLCIRDCLTEYSSDELEAIHRIRRNCHV